MTCWPDIQKSVVLSFLHTFSIYWREVFYSFVSHRDGLYQQSVRNHDSLCLFWRTSMQTDTTVLAFVSTKRLPSHPASLLMRYLLIVKDKLKFFIRYENQHVFAIWWPVMFAHCHDIGKVFNCWNKSKSSWYWCFKIYVTVFNCVTLSNRPKCIETFLPYFWWWKQIQSLKLCVW